MDIRHILTRLDIVNEDKSKSGSKADSHEKKDKPFDPDIYQAERNADIHYQPLSSDTEQAFKKFLLRSVQHSKEDDRANKKRIAALDSKYEAMSKNLTTSDTAIKGLRKDVEQLMLVIASMNSKVGK
jgi:hypothetical protein